MTPRHPLASTLAIAVILGNVYDRTTGQPLAHVTVTLGASHATTDAAGRFTFRNVKPGSSQLTLESQDVPEQHFTVRVGAVRNVHLELHACSTTLDYDCAAPGPGTQGGGAGAG